MYLCVDYSFALQLQFNDTLHFIYKKIRKVNAKVLVYLDMVVILENDNLNIDQPNN